MILPAAGQFPSASASADLNGDGQPDLVVANKTTGNVGVMLNLGGGAFAPAVIYPVGSFPFSILALDLNGDGKPDIAAANYLGASVSVLLNLGNGTFAPAIPYATSPGPLSIAAADLNGDGKPDIAAACSGGNVSVLLNTGNGVFAAAVDYAAGSGPFSIAAQDLDGDGKPDLAVANFVNASSGSVSVLLNLGNGTFGPPVNYVSGPGAQSIAAADLDGDGKPDLVTANSDMSLHSSGTVSVLHNLGNGTFAAPVNYPASATSVAVVAIDLNNDAKPDLVVSNLLDTGFDNPSVSVLLNLGNGTFAPPTNYLAGLQPAAASILDLNGDGKPDLAVGGGNYVRVMLNVGNGRFAAPVARDTGANPVSIATTDMNGDGKPDLVVANELSHTVSVMLALGNGTFAPPVDVPVGKYISSVAAADLNGDGKPDLVVADDDAIGGVSVMLNLGNGTFAAPVSYATFGGYTKSVITADLNGDGKPDLIATNSGNTGGVSVLLNLGNGTFAAAVHPTTSPGSSFVAVADLNGDGLLDLSVANGSFGGGVSVLINQGNGAFAPAVTYIPAASSRWIAIGDLNGDGKLDLAVANDADANQSTVTVLINQGNGTFVAKATYITGLNSFSVAIADLNGDGKLDVAVANVIKKGPSVGDVSVFFNQGDGTFPTSQRYDMGPDPRSILATDLNGDGRADLAVSNEYAGTVSIFLSTCLP